MPHVLGRDDVDVRVRNLIAGDDEADALAVERLSLCPTDAVGDREEVADEVGWRVDPVIDLGDPPHEYVPAGRRVDGHEGDTAAVAVDERGGDLAGDDPGEDGGGGRHGAVVCLARWKQSPRVGTSR